MYDFMQIRCEFTFLLSFIHQNWSWLVEHVGGLGREDE